MNFSFIATENRDKGTTNKAEGTLEDYCYDLTETFQGAAFLDGSIS